MNESQNTSHPDDAMNAIPVKIVDITQNYLNSLNQSVIQLKEARRAANILEGQHTSRDLSRTRLENSSTSTQRMNLTQSFGILPNVNAREMDPCLVALAPRSGINEYRADDMTQLRNVEDIFTAGFVIVRDNIDIADQYNENESWMKRVTKKLIAEVMEKTGASVLIGLVPVVGPIACFALSYRYIHQQLEDITIGRHNRTILRRVILSRMFKQLLLGLFVPVVGPIYNRYIQGTHETVDFARAQVTRHVMLSSLAYERHVNSLKSRYLVLKSEANERAIEARISAEYGEYEYGQSENFPSSSYRNIGACSCNQPHCQGSSSSSGLPSHLNSIDSDSDSVSDDNNSMSTISLQDHTSNIFIENNEEFDIEKELDEWIMETDYEGDQVTRTAIGDVSDTEDIELEYIRRNDAEQRGANEYTVIDMRDTENHGYIIPGQVNIESSFSYEVLNPDPDTTSTHDQDHVIVVLCEDAQAVAAGFERRLRQLNAHRQPENIDDIYETPTFEHMDDLYEEPTFEHTDDIYEASTFEHQTIPPSPVMEWMSASAMPQFLIADT
ncbi:hypothetical protein BGZ76_005288, partial [Entomortierella beljakovae]